jgi:STE24 endopeptidase
VLAAGLVADLVLWPRDQLPPIADVNQHEYFTQGFIDHAQAFRGLQTLLGLGASLMLVLVPLAVAVWWPHSGRGSAEGGRLGRWTDRRTGVLFGRGGAIGDALVGISIAALALLAALPFQFVAFLRARDYGLAVQGIPGWLWDWLLGVILVLLGIAVLAMIAGALIRRLARGWWLAFGVCLIALAIVFQGLAPIVVEPLFADFTKAPAGGLRNDVEAVAKKSGVHAGEIYTVDAGNRTTGANAYVTGLGSTKRVVIYDTLLKDFSPAERRQVVAHEFGHARNHDLVVGLMWFAFVSLLSLFAIDLLARTLAERRGVEFDSPAGLAMVFAAVMIAVAISQPASNAWSRAVEARADAFALRVTQRPEAAIALERTLTMRNISRPEPPSVLQFMFGTHPTTMQRIGMAETVKDEIEKNTFEPVP